MTPHRKLALLVTGFAVLIAAAWIVLLRRQVLTPRTAGRGLGVDLRELSRDLDDAVRQVDALRPEFPPRRRQPPPASGATPPASGSDDPFIITPPAEESP